MPTKFVLLVYNKQWILAKKGKRTMEGGEISKFLKLLELLLNHFVTDTSDKCNLFQREMHIFLWVDINIRC